jgi:uncharacterized protein
MANSFTASTTYFLQEGRENLEDCLKIAFQAAIAHDVRKIVIFTAYGEGVKAALDNFCSRDEYAQIQVVAVTFPAGKTFTNENNQPVAATIPDELMRRFEDCDVPLVRANLPFDAVEPSAAWRTVVGRGFNLLGETLNMFCGSMSLCVQAVSLACDAGYLELGEHVVSMTSDTAILVTATVTRKMLSEMVIREVLCKPVILTIGRKEQKTLPSVPVPGKPRLKVSKKKRLRR